MTENLQYIACRRRTAWSQAVRRRAQNRLHPRPIVGHRGQIRQLLLLGMDVARMNFSHGSHAENLRRIRTRARWPPNWDAPSASCRTCRAPRSAPARCATHSGNLLPGARVTITNKAIEGTAELPGHNVQEPWRARLRSARESCSPTDGSRSRFSRSGR